MTRKIIGIFFAILFVLLTYKYPLDFIKELPSDATLSQSEISELENYGLRFEEERAVDAGIVDGLTKTYGTVKAFLGGLIPFKKMTVQVADDYKVKAGGMSIGFCLNTKGVIVVGINDVLTEQGYAQPTKDADIDKGDCIIEVDGVEINNAEDLNVVVNSRAKSKNSLDILILRKGKTFSTNIKPALDKDTGTYKLGLWIRDSASGMGTVTYIKNDNNRFGSLGHSISDSDTGILLPVSGGQIYKSQIVGVVKGGKNQAGELRGTFIKTSKGIGTVDKNNKFGVFGNFNIKDIGEKYSLPVGTRAMVKSGKAKILSDLGNGIEEFDVEIVKIRNQKTANEKSMIIKIIDKDLIARAGGIVQGMSGSPIIQNGKIIGAVTHVFLNDATKGYGVFIDWMYNN